MAKRKPYAVHRLVDCGRDVALVRYDGDPDVFAALAESWLIDQGIDRSSEPPAPRLYRMNAVQSDEYGWVLGKPDKPGPGVFLGAVLTVARHSGELGEIASFNCWRIPCEAKRGERHYASCPNNSSEGDHA